MMTKWVAALVTASLLIPGISSASDWHVYSSDGEARHLVDMSSIVVEPDGTRLAWATNILNKPQKAPNNKLYSKLSTRMLADCGLKKLALLSTFFYDSTGALVESHSFDFVNLSDVPPDSTGEKLLGAVCAASPR